jgi:thiol-disulfide isomerase/thioredoxin
MRKVFSLLVVLIVVTTVAAQSGRKLKNPPPPKPPEPVAESLTNEAEPATVVSGVLTALPKGVLNRELEAVNNGSFRLADFTDKVIVVNLWATWCGPCRREIPDYEKVRKEYASRNVEFIALTTEDPIAARNRVQKFARDFNFGFRLGWADAETARALSNGRRAIPQTLVITSDGRVINHWTGYSPDQSGDWLRAAIERGLEATPASAKGQ